MQYIVSVLVVLVLQLVGGIVGFVYRDMVFDVVKEGLNNTLPRYNGESSADQDITKAWDNIQEQVCSSLYILFFSHDMCETVLQYIYATQGHFVDSFIQNNLAQSLYWFYSINYISLYRRVKEIMWWE